MTKKFSEFADESVLDGDKIRLDDVVNQEIIINNYSIKTSKFKDRNYMILQIIKEGAKYVLFTGSSVLADQVEKYKTELPFAATIRKINKYYTLT